MTAAAQDVMTVKLERTFYSMDADRDRCLDWTDYQKPADRCIQAYRLDKDDRRARALQTFCQIYWLELPRHAGVDGNRLTRDQFGTADLALRVHPRGARALPLRGPRSAGQHLLRTRLTAPAPAPGLPPSRPGAPRPHLKAPTGAVDCPRRPRP
ncbi:hypothetical protein ACFT0E_20205, partial [Streptomyces sp. NPDC057052]